MTKKPSPERVDTANPEWSTEDFAKAKPASEVLAGCLAAQAKEMLGPKCGASYSKSVATKEHVNVRFDADVLEIQSFWPGLANTDERRLGRLAQDAYTGRTEGLVAKYYS